MRKDVIDWRYWFRVRFGDPIHGGVGEKLGLDRRKVMCFPGYGHG
jgi:hypothetical protein